MTSVTDARKKAPVLRTVRDMALATAEWTKLDAEGREEEAPVYYRPHRWAEPEAYVVARQLHEGEQGLPEPRYTMILTSRDDLPVAEGRYWERGLPSLSDPLVNSPRIRQTYG